TRGAAGCCAPSTADRPSTTTAPDAARTDIRILEDISTGLYEDTPAKTPVFWAIRRDSDWQGPCPNWLWSVAMKRTFFITSVAVFSAMALCAAPAFADQHNRRSEGSRAESSGGNGGTHGAQVQRENGRAVERVAPRVAEERAIPRAAAPQN